MFISSTSASVIHLYDEQIAYEKHTSDHPVDLNITDRQMTPKLLIYDVMTKQSLFQNNCLLEDK